MSAFVIRDAEWPRDREAGIAFIDALQLYEHAFEPNRRIDPAVGADYFDVLLAAVAQHGGIVRIAEAGGRAIGWAAAWPELDSLYVVEDERRILYISELYVEEPMRGTGVGRALIAACEDWARGQGIAVARISVMSKNTPAAAAYERVGYAPYALRLTKRLS